MVGIAEPGPGRPAEAPNSQHKQPSPFHGTQFWEVAPALNCRVWESFTPGSAVLFPGKSPLEEIPAPILVTADSQASIGPGLGPKGTGNSTGQN